MSFSWNNLGIYEAKKYICGYCGNDISSEKGYRGEMYSRTQYIYFCHTCGKPTFFDEMNKQTPGSKFGNNVKDITDTSVEFLYNEARNCMKESAFTASVLSCRKLLMHIAVSKGAKDGLKFIEYVEYLSTNNFIPPGAKEWVDHIREKGNEANHEIKIMNKEEAEDLIVFSEMLLRLIYEFPASIQRKINPVILANI